MRACRLRPDALPAAARRARWRRPPAQPLDAAAQARARRTGRGRSGSGAARAAGVAGARTRPSGCVPSRRRRPRRSKPPKRGSRPPTRGFGSPRPMSPRTAGSLRASSSRSSSLLAGLAVMARRPPLLALADRGSTDELVKVRILLDSTLPVIRRADARSCRPSSPKDSDCAQAAASARAELVRSRQDLVGARAIRRARAAGAAAVRWPPAGRRSAPATSRLPPARRSSGCARRASRQPARRARWLSNSPPPTLRRRARSPRRGHVGGRPSLISFRPRRRSPTASARSTRAACARAGSLLRRRAAPRLQRRRRRGSLFGAVPRL